MDWTQCLTLLSSGVAVDVGAVFWVIFCPYTGAIQRRGLCCGFWKVCDQISIGRGRHNYQ